MGPRGWHDTGCAGPRQHSRRLAEPCRSRAGKSSSFTVLYRLVSLPLLTQHIRLQVYNLTTNPQKCLTECRRVLEPNGVLAASAWEGNDWLEMMKVIAAVKPELRNAVSAKWITPQAMQTDLDQASFRDVQVQSVPITVFFDTYDKFVDTLLTFQPRMVSLLREFTQDQRITLRKLLLAEMKAYCPEEPGNLRGTVLVATGRK